MEVWNYLDHSINIYVNTVIVRYENQGMDYEIKQILNKIAKLSENSINNRNAIKIKKICHYVFAL